MLYFALQVIAAGDLCAICQEKMHAPILLRCKHIFCEDCVSEWLVYTYSKHYLACVFTRFRLIVLLSSSLNSVIHRKHQLEKKYKSSEDNNRVL